MTLPTTLVQRVTELLLDADYAPQTADEALRSLAEAVRVQRTASVADSFRLYLEFWREAGAKEQERWLELAAAELGRKPSVGDAIPSWDPVLRALLESHLDEWSDWCRAHLEEFSASGQEQLACLWALRGLGPWPPEVGPRLARAYLNAPPGQFFWEEASAELREVLVQGAAALHRDPYPLLQWARIEQLLAWSSSLAEPLLVNYVGRDFRSRAFQLVDRSPTLAADLQRLLASGARLSFQGQVAAALLVTDAFGEQFADQIPPAVRSGLRFDICAGDTFEIEWSLRAYAHLSPALAGGLLREALGEVRALALLPSVQDPEVLRELLLRLDKEEAEVEPIVATLIACGEIAREVVLSVALEGKPGPARAQVVIDYLLQRGQGEDAAVLLPYLGHTAQGIRRSAYRALERLGASVRPHLEEACRSPRKAVRERSVQLLRRLDLASAAEDTPLARLRRDAESRPRREEQEFLALAEREDPASLEELRHEVRRHGARALIWLRERLQERVSHGETRIWCQVVQWLSGDADAMWVAVETFATMPKVSAGLWSRPRRALESAGALLGAPLAHFLRHESSDYDEALYRMLSLYAPELGVECFLQGLEDARKAVRAHCVDGLSRLPVRPTARLLELLEKGEPGTRSTAAELLAVWGPAELAPELSRLLVQEKSSLVTPYLEDALVACGGAASLFAIPDGDELTVAAASAYLERRGLPRGLPAFFHPDQLPVLRWRSGAELGEAARRGLVGRLAKLDSTLKGRALRPIVALLNTEDREVWAAQLYNEWAKRRDTKHPWAALQLSLLGSTAQLRQAARGLGQVPGREYTASSTLLKVCQWHPAAEGTAWLAYWSEALPSMGLRRLSRELLGRMAYKHGTTVAALRDAQDPFLLERLDESDLLASDQASAASDWLIGWEHSWLTGRSWRLAELDRVFSRWPAVVGGSWLLLGDGKPVHWLGPGLWGDPFHADRVVEPDATVRLAHPWDFPEDTWTDWEWGLEARGLEPPFPQRRREAYEVARWSELAARSWPVDSYLKWRRKAGWFHGEPMDGGWVFTNARRLPGRDLILRLHHSGYPLGEEPTAPLKFLQLEAVDRSGTSVAIPPAVYSEVHRSLVCRPD